MNNDQLIEAIIKEVKRVLTERGVPMAPGSGETGATVAPSAGVPARASSSMRTPSRGVPEIKLQPAPPGTADMLGSRDITGKQVITQKDLEGFKGTSIQVTPGAVITPLAVDYAKEKGITITRLEGTAVKGGNAVSTPGTVTTALVFSPDFSGDRGIVNAILNGKGFQIKEFSDQSYETAVKKLGNTVASGAAHFGVCIERTGMEGPIHANRNTSIRAVHCRNTIDARAARVDYGANVIVIDSTSDPEAVISGFCGM